jgi:N-formylglutamate deformylase
VEMRRIDNRDRLLRRFYDPHHRALEEWASQALEEHGRCLILDGHSFPDSPHPSDLNQQLPRPEVNVGTDSFHTPAWLREATVRRVEAQGWSVGLDWPYRGSISPASRYGVDNRVHSVMIEVNRRMYMNEQTGERSGGFGETKVQLEEALGDIFRFWLEAP